MPVNKLHFHKVIGILNQETFFKAIMNEIIDKTAVLSKDEKYRYVLSRTIDKKLPMIAFVGFNPSTADHKEDR